MASYEFIYSGTNYPLEPSSHSVYSGATGYSMRLSELSQATDPRTANQLKEASEHFNTGVKNIELSPIDPSVFESIPKDHLKEIHRLAKLTGAEISLHAPMIDPSGITEHGWNEINQGMAERQLWSAVERSHDLNPKGNVPVTMHASTVPLPPAVFKIKGEDGEEVESVLLIDPNGTLKQIRKKEKFFPTEEGTPSKKFEPEKEIKRANKENWIESLGQVNLYAQRGNEIIREMQEKFGALSQIKEIEKDNKSIGKLQEGIKRNLSHGALYLRDSYRTLKELYDLAYKNANSGDKQKMNAFAQRISPHVKKFEGIVEDPKELKLFSDLIEDGLDTLKNVQDPQILKPLREFAIDKASDTVSELALKSHKKFGSTAPIISLENHPAQTSTLTRAEDLRDVIKSARKKFIEKAKKDGIGSGEAEKAAEKLIGATWDVGHINMLRRYGYEKKDIIKESEKIAPFVKHIHLSDNFGHEHTELPMGMGNVPIKEILQKLGKEGFNARKVIEAGNWWQHFSPGGKSNPPLMPTLKAFGSPLYSMYMQPAWRQTEDISGGYFIGQGAINPEYHHSIYGAGFTNLPKELGGQMPGGASRATGTPMA